MSQAGTNIAEGLFLTLFQKGANKQEGRPPKLSGMGCGQCNKTIAASDAGFTGAGWIALTGDLPATVEAIKSTSPLILYPFKAAVAFPLVYHYLGGVRHVFWDKAKYGNQVSFPRPESLQLVL